jgi:hypothetical protein
MDGKLWYQSKVVWLNVILSLMGIMTLVADFLGKNTSLTAPGIIMLIVGCLGIILRVWFTEQPIAR